MAEMWAETKKNKQLIKFGGGFYAGKISYEAPKVPTESFVINGFYMDMRSGYV